MKVFYHNHVLRNSTPREWRRQNSPIRNRKGDNKMNKRDYNVVGKEEQEIMIELVKRMRTEEPEKLLKEIKQRLNIDDGV